jgi:hypothetical protein
METDLAATLSRRGRYSQRLIANALGISRSNLINRLSEGCTMYKLLSKPLPNLKAANINLLNEIKEILKERPSYGYRRVTALLNAMRYKQGVSRVKPSYSAVRSD